jgi:hypothetical protein
MGVADLIFEVVQESEGGFVAECLTESIVTQADDWVALREAVADAVKHGVSDGFGRVDLSAVLQDGDLIVKVRNTAPDDSDPAKNGRTAWAWRVCARESRKPARQAAEWNSPKHQTAGFRLWSGSGARVIADSGGRAKDFQSSATCLLRSRSRNGFG